MKLLLDLEVQGAVEHAIRHVGLAAVFGFGVAKAR